MRKGEAEDNELRECDSVLDPADRLGYLGMRLGGGVGLAASLATVLWGQLGSVSRPSDAACCLARSRRFSMLVVLLLRLGRPPEAWSSGLFQTC